MKNCMSGVVAAASLVLVAAASQTPAEDLDAALGGDVGVE